jgi:Peptidase_C39 like family
MFFCRFYIIALISYCYLNQAQHQNFTHTFGLDTYFKATAFETETLEKFIADHDKKNKRTNGYFEFIDPEKTKAYFSSKPFSNVRQVITLFDQSIRVIEAHIQFEDGKFSSSQYSLYNRGDVGDIKEEKFIDIINKTKEKIDALFGIKGIDKGIDPNSSVKLKLILWEHPQFKIHLESSQTKGTPFQGEFIRLRFSKNIKLKVGETVKVGSKLKMIDLLKFIKKEHGDVYVTIPMVDQGQKGYCTIATCERVFQYYQIPCDQHELAQLAGSSDGNGTNLNNIASVLDKLEGKFGVNFKILKDIDRDEWVENAKDYNTEAKKLKGKGFDEGHARYDPWAFFDYANLDLLKKVRAKGIHFKQYQRWIQEYIDKGIPLVWSMQLGKYPENEKIPQSNGGHTRMIIGYNKDKNQILFSDSWGKGHELKRMSLEDSYSCTFALYVVFPIQLK